MMVDAIWRRLGEWFRESDQGRIYVWEMVCALCAGVAYLSGWAWGGLILLCVAVAAWTVYRTGLCREIVRRLERGEGVLPGDAAGDVPGPLLVVGRVEQLERVVNDHDDTGQDLVYFKHVTYSGYRRRIREETIYKYDFLVADDEGGALLVEADGAEYILSPWPVRGDERLPVGGGVTVYCGVERVSEAADADAADEEGESAGARLRAVSPPGWPRPVVVRGDAPEARDLLMRKVRIQWVLCLLFFVLLMALVLFFTWRAAAVRCVGCSRGFLHGTSSRLAACGDVGGGRRWRAGVGEAGNRSDMSWRRWRR